MVWLARVGARADGNVAESHDFREFFPTSLLETGWDIMFFWVCAQLAPLPCPLTTQAKRIISINRWLA